MRRGDKLVPVGGGKKLLAAFHHQSSSRHCRPQVEETQSIFFAFDSCVNLNLTCTLAAGGGGFAGLVEGGGSRCTNHLSDGK